MADKLVELQEDVKKQERQAMFGRIAAGLVHDISHPIQNIGNSCKLILKLGDDAEYRETFQRTVTREFASIKRVLADLRNLARPMPLEKFPVEINRVVKDTIDAMEPLAATAGLTLESRLTDRPLYVEGDLFALGRVYRNLIVNAIEATSPGGSVRVETEDLGGRVRIAVSDTGLGIPPERLGAIFEDFHTTKRRGLGLGLAISRKDRRAVGWHDQRHESGGRRRHLRDRVQHDGQPTVPESGRGGLTARNINARSRSWRPPTTSASVVVSDSSWCSSSEEAPNP